MGNDPILQMESPTYATSRARRSGSCTLLIFVLICVVTFSFFRRGSLFPANDPYPIPEGVMVCPYGEYLRAGACAPFTLPPIQQVNYLTVNPLLGHDLISRLRIKVAASRAGMNVQDGHAQVLADAALPVPPLPPPQTPSRAQMESRINGEEDVPYAAQGKDQNL